MLLTANSWNTTAHPRMQDWLTLRLYEDYPALRAIHKDVPRALVDNGMVLPVIDGLDELDPAYRSAILKGLNESLGAADPLVLTCRTDEYADAVNDTDVLTAAAVIEARPLTARDAASYLDNCLPPRQRADWKPILEELRSTDDTPLAEICATPLGLWLLRTVHVENKTDPTPLVDPAHYPDADAIRAHLFDGLIPAIITKRLNKSDGTDPLRPRRIWEPDATRQRLAYLAVQLHDNRDLRWWHLPTAVTFIVTITLTWLTFGLVAMVASGLTYVLMLALEGVRTIGTDELAYDYPDVRITETFMLGAVPMLWAIALVGALIVGARIRRVSGSGYINLRLRGRGRRLAREAAYGLVGGSMVGMTVVMFPLAAALIGWSRGEPVEDLGFNLMLALRIGLTIGAPIGTAVGLARWARSPGIVDRSRTPISTYRDSRNLTAVLVVTIGLVGWFAVGLLGVYVGSWRGWEDMVQMMLAYGLLGLVVGSMVGLMIEPAWIGFVVRSRWLTIRGKLPWQVMGFLDDAHRLGLLRTAGAVYQFRHAELQDHLARSATDTTPPRRS
ncbi:hypothetical protein [Rhodococcus wratislaviensis]|uniref:hypothetical protein n=1 Tax=Rhodococcus wratislaviensis TaxID=44752 RepID=UPI003515A526